MSIETYPNRPQNNGKAIAGFILLAVGGLLLLRQFDFFIFPGWLFSWPTLLIVIGLYTGAKHNFRNAAWLVMVVIGSIFLLENIFDGIAIRHFVWPLILITLGLWFILRRNNHNPAFKNDSRQKKSNINFDPATQVDYTVTDADADAPTGSPQNPYNHPPQHDDYIDTVTVFGNVKKIMLSKNFKGGDMVNIFGGSELDFTQADINGRVLLDVTQLFGGVKLIVPPHWQVTSDLAAIFGGIDDKRFNKNVAQSPDKVLVLTGVSIFAGIDIRSY